MENNIQILTIKDMHVILKRGEDANELVDKIEKLIKRFSESGKWTFQFKVET